VWSSALANPAIDGADELDNSDEDYDLSGNYNKGSDTDTDTDTDDDDAFDSSGKVADSGDEYVKLCQLGRPFEYCQWGVLARPCQLQRPCQMLSVQVCS
jgi:hypothetical protein